MPLVERYNDWNISDGSFDDPHRLDFDHRIGAESAHTQPGLANVDNNIKATCVITFLKPQFGWTDLGGRWIYDPSSNTNLKSIWQNNLAECVRHDEQNLKHVFGNVVTNPTTAYTGLEAKDLLNKIDRLEWPSEDTEFVSHFESANQYIIGPGFCSAYHLGDGYVGTVGHFLDRVLLNRQLGELRVVFNWVGQVGKKIFKDSEIFSLEKVVLCDTHGPAPTPTKPVGIAAWSKRWDTAIVRLRGAPDQFANIKTAKYATRPPSFGTSVYSIGCPLGTQLKLSPGGHVLRYSLQTNDKNPFSHQIASHGTFTTDLDQFGGNSGGPVVDANTGHIVGHSSSHHDAVAEHDVAAILNWADEYADKSKNAFMSQDINRILQRQRPDDRLYRIHPKFLRSLSGFPGNIPLIKCATNVCPGDLGPNKVTQAPGRHQAVFSRHHFNTKDVFLSNITARVDRTAIFMTPLNLLLSESNSCTLTINVAGKPNVFKRPDTTTSLVITTGASDWRIQHLDFDKVNVPNIHNKLHVCLVTLDLVVLQRGMPTAFLDSPRGIIDWTAVRLEQPDSNPPIMVGLNFSICRQSFAFPVNNIWPVHRPDVTNDPADAHLEWPEETFDFATTAGETSTTLQTGGSSTSDIKSGDEPGLWTWKAPLDRVWTNPKQPSHGLRDSLMDNIHQELV